MQILKLIPAHCCLLTLTIAIHLPSFHNIFPIINESFDPTSVLSKNLTAQEVVCRISYGQDMNSLSCHNAWEKIDRSRNTQLYRQRWRSEARHAPFQPLPVRYLSDDCLCAIDVRNSLRHDGDVTTGLQISAQADRLLDFCVDGKKEGGEIRGFSKYDPFEIFQTLYRDRQRKRCM